MRRAAIVALALLNACTRAGVPPSAATPSSNGTVAAITPADLERRLFIIAHDSMMGRETGSEGDYKTAEYIASEFRRLGLRPAGDNGTWFQTVPFWRVALDPRSRITVGSTALTLRRDYLPAFTPVPLRPLENIEPIFGGTLGDTARWIRPEDARGRLVILHLPA